MIKILSVALLLAIVLILVVNQRGKTPSQLTLGYSQEAPYAYVDAETGLEGIYVDAAEHIAADMQITNIDWVLLDFFQLFSSLLDKRIDVIAAGITITPERTASYCFAEPLLQADSGVLVLKNSNKLLAVNNGLQGTIAALADSVEHKLLKQNSHSVLPLSSIREGAIAVLNGDAVALACTLPALNQVMRSFEGVFDVLPPPPQMKLQHYAAFAFHYDNEALIYKWNKAQRQLRHNKAFISQASEYGFTLPSLSEQIPTECYEP